MKPQSAKIHFEALLPKQREVLSASAKPAQGWGAYLAGGLAVALQLVEIQGFGRQRPD